MREAAARSDNDLDIAAVIAGKSSGLVRDIPPVTDIVHRVMREASALFVEGRLRSFPERYRDKPASWELDARGK